MSPRARAPIILRLVALFLAPLTAILVLLASHGNAFGLALVLYFGLLIGLGLFAAPTMVDGPVVRVVVGLALAFGMFFVHLFVAFAGCSALVRLN
jgi:hypothetical protein